MQRGEVADSSSSVASSLGGALVDAPSADVGIARERSRQHRLRKAVLLLTPLFAFLWWRILDGRPFDVFALPPMPEDPILWAIPLVLVLAIASVAILPLASGRSPHLTYRPEQITVTFDDVKGLDPIVEEVVKTLNTFLGYARFRERLGGTPRRGLLFEGAPGTGKTHLAKAMARHGGVPFLFVSATSFQSMWYGATARKIRAYFRALRKAARREGGAIGFIEEIDAIATTRGGVNATPRPTSAGCSTASSGLDLVGRAGPGAGPAGIRVDGYMSESTGGIVNELLIQMQSFDTPPWYERLGNAVIDWCNGFLPAGRQLARRTTGYNNLLLIAATNRADRLDPALLRPGRFDRRLTFERPAKDARRELVDHFLATKSHDDDLARPERRDRLAAQTFGYTPVMIEHLLDEALLAALRNGRDAMSWQDVETARLTEEVGLKNPVPYTRHERAVVATHEAGHATVAHLTGRRRLEVLSIVKRSGSLGLLAHGDLDEVYTWSKSELLALIDIAMGGMVAEELFFGESGTGPSGDLHSATQIAAEIVGAAGMAGSLVSLSAVENSATSDTNLVGRVLADPVARPEVDRLLAVSKARVRGLLGANRHLVEALRDALVERDELIGEQITDTIASAGAPVTEGLRVERRGGDRRRLDWLAGDDPSTEWAGIPTTE